MYWSAPTAALRNNDMPKAREVDGMQTIPAVGRGGSSGLRGLSLMLSGRPQPLKSNSLNEM